MTMDSSFDFFIVSYVLLFILGLSPGMHACSPYAPLNVLHTKSLRFFFLKPFKNVQKIFSLWDQQWDQMVGTKRVCRPFLRS